MQVYATLAYGYTGIAYFCYDHAQQFRRGLLNNDGVPNKLYYYAQRLNPEVANLGRCLRFLRSTDVAYISGRGNEPPMGTTRGHDDITFIQDMHAPWRDGLIGRFVDDAGGRYFMLVNLWHGADKSADELTATIRMRFDSDLAMLYRLNRRTGEIEQVALQPTTENGKEIMVELPGGTGDLFKIGDPRFAGIE